MGVVCRLKRVMKDNNLDHEQVATGLNWSIGELKTIHVGILMSILNWTMFIVNRFCMFQSGHVIGADALQF